MMIKTFFQSVGSFVVKAAKATVGKLLTASIENVAKAAIFVGSAVACFVMGRKAKKVLHEEVEDNRTITEEGLNLNFGDRGQAKKLHPLMANAIDGLNKEIGDDVRHQSRKLRKKERVIAEDRIEQLADLEDRGLLKEIESDEPDPFDAPMTIYRPGGRVLKPTPYMKRCMERDKKLDEIRDELNAPRLRKWVKNAVEKYQRDEDAGLMEYEVDPRGPFKEANWEDSYVLSSYWKMMDYWFQDDEEFGGCLYDAYKDAPWM